MLLVFVFRLSLSFSLVWVWFVFVRFFCHHKGSGSYVHFCPRPCSSTYRWAKLPTHRHKGTTLNEVRALTPPWPCSHRMWVIAKRLGRLLWLVHAMQQDMVIYFGATTSWLTSSTCSDRSTLKPGVKQLAMVLPQTLLTSVCFKACFTPRMGGTVSELSFIPAGTVVCSKATATVCVN